MNRLTYSVAEVADLLGVSRSTAYELVAQGAIPVVPLKGRRKLVPRWAIDELLGQTSDRPGSVADSSTPDTGMTSRPTLRVGIATA